MKRSLRLLVVAGLAVGSIASPAPARPVSDKRADSSSLVQTRQRFFGKQNVDPQTGAVRKDRVILSWLSVASYAASFNGHVVLLDAWVARGSHSGYVPTSPAEIAQLDPEYIFIGHGDFDHAADAAEIAKTSGATVVGSQEHCDSVRSQAGEDLPCIALFPAGAPAGLRTDVNDLILGVDISAVAHIHSSVEQPTFDPEHLPCPPVWNAMDTVEHPPTPDDLEHLASHQGDARGVNILYQFRTGDFSLVHHDTVGKIDDDPLVVEALRDLPSTDVEFGAVLAFGQATNCLRSLGLYLRALRPTVYAATHHDNFTFGIGGNARDLEPYVRDELAQLPKKIRPELIYTYDPDDYLNPKPFTFTLNDSRWR